MGKYRVLTMMEEIVIANSVEEAEKISDISEAEVAFIHSVEEIED